MQESRRAALAFFARRSHADEDGRKSLFRKKPQESIELDA